MAVVGLSKRSKHASPSWRRWRAATLMVAAGYFSQRQFKTTKPRTIPSGAPRSKRNAVASPVPGDEVRKNTATSPSSRDWRAALRVLGAAAAANGTGSSIANEGDVVTFPSFMDAYRFAPQATFGVLMATCTKAFGDEVPTLAIGGAATVDLNNMKRRATVPSYEEKLRSNGAPPLVMNDLMTRFGNGKGNDGATTIEGDSYFSDGGERIVWILAGHLRGDDAVRCAEEAVRGRLRLYPKSRVVLVDNDSPPAEAEEVRRIVESMPGNHSYVRNPPPSLYEQGAYHSGIRELRRTVPRPPEGEVVVFTQATTVVLRPLPFDEIFEEGCDLRPMYQACCGQLVTPPCDESKQMDWTAASSDIFARGRYPPDTTCQSLCPNRTCVLNYTNSFGPYKDRICERQSAEGLMHASMITTGALARDVLFRGLGFELPCKMSEKLSGYWRLAGMTRPSASCMTSLDVDTGSTPSELSYFAYKFHGSAEVYGQGLQAGFLEWLHALDDDSNGEVTLGEMMIDGRRWKQSAREFCTSSFMDDGHRLAIKRYIELAAEWYSWCDTTTNTTPLAEEESFYNPIMCEAAREIRRGANKSNTLLESYYKRWLQHCKLNGC